MQSNAVSIFSCGIALLWLPIAIRFFKAWRLRRNPLSLAITWMMLVASYLHTMVAMDETSAVLRSGIGVGLSAAACINFYLAFRWSAYKFRGQRRSDRTAMN